MPAKMQLLIRCNGRIFLAVCLILFVGYTAQGAPVQKARYQRVRCRPNAWSANCIEEKGPWFYMPTSGANRILPPMADPSLMKRYQELRDVFPLSDEESGSGFDAAVGMEPDVGSGFGDDFPESKPPVLPAGLQGGKLKQELTAEDFLL
ncbi:serglycin [Phaenicophaeus curvirostris]|uniref:serglycin n=1 Tax=Phaenicophaeus curvirostris TaxID=33595 RepID=UPI0037F100FD